jgi:uncharacterized protein YqeY
MSFEETLKGKIATALFSSDRRNLLKLVLGEHQQLAAKQAMNDEHGYNIVKKIMESNRTSLKYLRADDSRAEKLEEENECLAELLPKYLSKEAISAILVSENLALKSYKSDGQAVGVAMKHFKATGQFVEGNTVKEAVTELRA